MSEIGERISKIVKDSGLTRTAFAEKIGLTQSYVSGMCLGKKMPGDRTVKDICREFNVNEKWIRTGEGDPYLIEDEDLSAMLGKMLHGEPSFKQRLISALMRMSPEEWALLEKKAWELVAETGKGTKETGPEGPAPEDATDQ